VSTEGKGAQALTDKINDLIREGNVRRIVVRNDEGRTVLDLPIAIGLVAAFIAPTIAMAGAAIGLIGGWSIQVERRDEASSSTEDDEAPEHEQG
jgi:Domain of unknown function (DUF4342)